MKLPAALLISVLLAPAAVAHGALTINEFDTYAISDFEGQEDSFPWEGFEIWDVYAGDGHNPAFGHGVYFKANFAGDGTVRPSGSETWEITFSFSVGNESFSRSIVHDGAEVTTDFEQLDWQIADGNVFQVHAWVPVNVTEGAIRDLIVLSSVDGDPRDIAPGGVYDPATGEEVPVSAPPSPAFPAMGEGRIVEEVPLTGSAKFLEVVTEPRGDAYAFNVTNPLAAQGQHFILAAQPTPGWAVFGPGTSSLDGGASTEFTVSLEDNGTIAPLRIDLMTDIGGLHTYFAYADADGVHVVQDPALATTYAPEPVAEDAPGLPLWLLLAGLVMLVRRR